MSPAWQGNLPGRAIPRPRVRTDALQPATLRSSATDVGDAVSA